jgi:chromatin assembly factor 1 subunit B
MSVACVAQKLFDGHQHYVQGVAWDPLGECIVSQSTDRTMRVMRASADTLRRQRAKGPQSDCAAAAAFTQAHVVYKHVIADSALPAPLAKPRKVAAVATGTSAENVNRRSDTPDAAQGEAGMAVNGDCTAPARGPVGGAAAATHKAAKPATGEVAGYIFQDESLNTFFRRLAFSPEGSFVVAPGASLGPLAPSSRRARHAGRCMAENTCSACLAVQLMLHSAMPFRHRAKEAFGCGKPSAILAVSACA